MAGIYIHNFTKERYEELLMWARVGANNCMIGENTEITVVPDHGRLIDADVFVKDECNYCDGACEALPCDCLNCHAERRCDFMLHILDAPTVIPADKEEQR